MSELAHVMGRTDAPLIEMTIGAMVDATAARYPELPALIACHQGIRMNWAELRETVDRLACSFIRLGLKPGDRVGIWAPNCAEWALTQFATAKAGLILVTINPAYRLSEIEYALNKVGCRALVSAQRFKTSDYVAVLRELAPEIDDGTAKLAAKRLPSLEFLIALGADAVPGFARFDDLLTEPADTERADLEALGERLDADEPINIQFTSGTTGAPKGATLSHRNILNNGFFVTEAIGLAPGDRLCIPVPLYHCFGMVLGNLGCLAHGAAMVYPSDAFDPGAVLDAIAGEGCVGVYGVPTMFIALLDHPDCGRLDLPSLRTGVMAGSPCPIEVMKTVIDKLGMRDVTIAYGMTETSPVSFQSGMDDPVTRRVSTVGRVQPHCEVKIVGPEGETVKRGEPGELCTRGYLVMKGYWNDEARTAESIDADGFMHSGDLATIDDEGYGNIVGRLKDMVIRGGENVYPREVEEFLYTHPKIRDVQVVGVPDRKYGEELCACVIASDPSLTGDELRAFCQGKIAHYKIPRYVELVEAFPMTVTGKIQKFALRSQMSQTLGLTAEATA
ncbi:AMP-binding protein [Jiella sp. MQZ9-1]|uniref:3-methylmercaptopropionyl-CoA ligase n=1 Tax=Jiella flava TaxID=2816857 RepID=A0A939FU53_9HYPH|nr:AMP-binding protein [Jiella flava]MBO0661602.1 AMP-binding protein [Jiella flava]MCD2470244.1 AMP-binding protein [Jiella flava]